MNNNIKIAKQLVRIARTLIGYVSDKSTSETSVKLYYIVEQKLNGKPKLIGSVKINESEPLEEQKKTIISWLAKNKNVKIDTRKTIFHNRTIKCFKMVDVNDDFRYYINNGSPFEALKSGELEHDKSVRYDSKSTPPGEINNSKTGCYVCKDMQGHEIIKVMMNEEWMVESKKWKIERVLRGKNLWKDGYRIEEGNNSDFTVCEESGNPLYVVEFLYNTRKSGKK